MRSGLNLHSLACTRGPTRRLLIQSRQACLAPWLSWPQYASTDADAAPPYNLAPWPRRQRPQCGVATRSQWASVNFLLPQASYRQFNQG